jgi:hypothetical protein
MVLRLVYERRTRLAQNLLVVGLPGGGAVGRGELDGVVFSDVGEAANGFEFGRVGMGAGENVDGVEGLVELEAGLEEVLADFLQGTRAIESDY